MNLSKLLTIQINQPKYTIEQLKQDDIFIVFLGSEHDWSDEFTSAIGGSILGSEEKSFFDSGYFKSGSKVLTNLFYKPSSKFGAFSVGVEVEYAERKNITSPSNNTIRVSSLVIYNF